MNRAPAAERDRTGGVSFRDCLAQLDEAQKPGAGVPAYTRWINRRLARYAAAAAVALRISPNMVTAASAAVSLCGLLLLLLRPPGVITGMAAAVLLAAGYVLDSADGQVARVTGRGGPAGEWLDHVVDSVRTPAVHLAVLGGWALHTDASRLMLALPVLYCLLSTGHFMSQILAEQLVRRHRQAGRPEPAPSRLRSFLLLPSDAGVLCWVFACWGNQGGFLIAYGCLFLLNLLAGAASMRRKYRSLVSL
ncbi:CDP-alcohol phosphatidyltransferase family protein [Arthrobacter sp. zg-Y179]|uniref:CDP-alcohol phosphatidyltransferase family protein n=1 Tax=Arthrobacter sp. zg-Y179 TaxID=2894188 RepID=UPI001E49A6AE|nr:CDP-alcohol phosphatidyltransferase family protein [Arthrobacter sp. zg-Y179]MCC9175201.1 CDP-alcohol phosphatidyltransferase family protein [Arthrobacter sp. zg-Y179]